MKIIKTISRQLIQVLAFFRLLDENLQLSLTNIAVIIVLVKVAVAPTIDASIISALLTCLGAYNLKRYIVKGKK